MLTYFIDYFQLLSCTLLGKQMCSQRLCSGTEEHEITFSYSIPKQLCLPSTAHCAVLNLAILWGGEEGGGEQNKVLKGWGYYVAINGILKFQGEGHMPPTASPP